jgi:hypothetical protein
LVLPAELGFIVLWAALPIVKRRVLDAVFCAALVYRYHPLTTCYVRSVEMATLA